nr:hypothetical protein [Leptolyngbya sp. 7M]
MAFLPIDLGVDLEYRRAFVQDINLIEGGATDATNHPDSGGETALIYVDNLLQLGWRQRILGVVGSNIPGIPVLTLIAEGLQLVAASAEQIAPIGLIEKLGQVPRSPVYRDAQPIVFQDEVGIVYRRHGIARTAGQHPEAAVADRWHSFCLKENLTVGLAAFSPTVGLGGDFPSVQVPNLPETGTLILGLLH